MLPHYIVFVSLINSSASSFLYIRDTFRGLTRPNRISWFIWFLAPFVGSLLLFSKGGGLSALPLLISSLTSFLIFLASFKNKNSYWKLGKLDYICLVFALLSIVSWVLFEEGVLATIFAILVDLIAFIPTYVKSWEFPDTETLWPYYSGMFNSLLSLVTLTVFTFVTYGFVLYFFLGCLTQVVIVFYRKRVVKFV